MGPATIWTHSDRNYSLSIFILFLALVSAWPLPYLLREAEISGPIGFYGMLGAVCLSVLGMLMLQYTGKRYRVEPGRISVKDGWFSRTQTYTWEGPAAIHLRTHENGHGLWWAVELACGKPRYTLHRSQGDPTETRGLAVSLARALACPLIEGDDEATQTIIPADEIDLPLPERIRRHPQLLNSLPPKPPGAGVRLREDERGLHFVCRNSPGQVAGFVLPLLFFAAALGMVPMLPDSSPQHAGTLPRSAWDRARHENNYDYYWLCGGFLLVVTGILAGSGKELCASRNEIRCSDTAWGLPLRTSRIDVARLREINVQYVHNGALLEVMGDGRTLGGRVENLAVARWMAERITHFYASA